MMRHVFCTLLLAFSFFAAVAEGRRVIRAAEHVEKSGNYIVKLRNSISHKVFERTLRNALDLSNNAKVYVRSEGLFKFFTINLTETVLAEVKDLEGVEYIEEETMATGMAPTNSWALDRIDQVSRLRDNVYNPGTGRNGKGIDIYVLDTGINYNHYDFGGRAQYPGFDPVDDYLGSSQKGEDCHGHGTHVASLAVGEQYGVAKQATVYSVRVLQCNESTPWSIIMRGLNLVAEKVKKSDRRAIISMSLGGPYIYSVNELVQEITNVGIPVVVAAGNDKSDACLYSPASAPSAVTVAGTRDGDAVYFLTNGGSCVDIFAPGENIRGADFKTSYGEIFLSGTSMATPIVSGVLAIYLQERLELTVTQLTDRMIQNSLKGVLDLSPLKAFGLSNSTPNRFIQVKHVCAVSGIDLVFLLDASGSIGSANFGLIKDFVTNVVNGLDIGPDDVQVAVIKYSSSADTEFHLNQYHNKSAVLQAVSEIIYTSGGTATDLGLQTVLAEFNNYARPVGEGIPRVAFVLTDGQSNDFQATVDAARQLHDANIEVYAVAIGSNADNEELSAIAMRAENVLTTNFVVVELKELQELLDREACEASVFASVGQQFASTLKDGEVAYFEYDLPDDGLTLCIEVIQGYVVIYVSTKVSNPNEALNDLEVEATSKVCLYVPPETTSNERRRRQSSVTDSSANETAKVYISIEGHSSLNRFVLNTTYDDTTETPLKITFERDSPVVSGNDTIAYIRTNKPVMDMECRMSGTKEVKNCTSGYVEFNDLPDRNKYTLKVVAETEEGETATIRREFRIERPGFCSAHLINEGVSIQGRKVTVQFSPSGGTQNTECILNPPKTIENPFFSCTSPVIMYLPPGPHKLKITPWGCGRNRKPLVVTFEV